MAAKENYNLQVRQFVLRLSCYLICIYFLHYTDEEVAHCSWQDQDQDSVAGPSRSFQKKSIVSGMQFC